MSFFISSLSTPASLHVAVDIPQLDDALRGKEIAILPGGNAPDAAAL
jgi:hypothetical protein